MVIKYFGAVGTTGVIILFYSFKVSFQTWGQLLIRWRKSGISRSACHQTLLRKPLFCMDDLISFLQFVHITFHEICSAFLFAMNKYLSAK